MHFPRTIALAPALLLIACSPKTPTTTEPPAASEPAPPPVAAAPQEERNTLSFPIGALAGFALRDGSLTVPNDSKTLAINKTPEDVAKLLGEAGLPTTTLSLSIQ